MKTQTFLNNDIYQMTGILNNIISDNTNYFPAKTIFYIQKVVKQFLSMYEEIEQGRIAIIDHYKKQSEDGSWSIPEESIQVANNELKELLLLKQDVTFNTIPLSWLDGIKFTSEQMNALSFMIEDE